MTTYVEFLRWLMLCEGGVKTPQELSVDALQRLDLSQHRQLLGIYTLRRQQFIQRCVKAGRIHRKFERGLLRRADKVNEYVERVEGRVLRRETLPE